MAKPIACEYRETFAEVEAIWRLGPDLLEHYRGELERILARLEIRIVEVGGWKAARYDGHARAEMLAADLLLQQAAFAYVFHVGSTAIRGRSLGGKSKPAPDWHGQAVKRARVMLLQGRGPREVSGILAQSFGVTAQSVRRVLVRAGVLQAEKKAA